MSNEASRKTSRKALEAEHSSKKSVVDEQTEFESWLAHNRPSGDVESVQRQWYASGDYADFRDATNPASPPAEPTGKQPLSTERAELIAELRTAHAGHSDEGPSAFSDAADMLEADDQEMSNLLARIHRDGGHSEAEHGRHKSVIAADLIVAKLNALSDAQQVAVPAGIPHSGADEMPPIFGRRWRLARDGFGLQRDDESGNYVHIDDAISTMHAMLSAAPQGDKT